MNSIQEVYLDGARVRIDVFVSAIAEVTRSRAANLIADGCVLLNGKTATKSDKLQSGDIVNVTIPEPVSYDIVPQNLNLDIVYEDDDLLVVNKPKGMVVHPAAGNFEVADATPEQVAWSGIGQHKDQVNPCAFMTFMGAIAGDGIGAMPYIVSEVTVGGRTTYNADTQKGNRIISVETARILQEYMRNNVESRYGVENFPDVVVCAKTGTAEVGGDKKPNATFSGFVLEEDYPLAFIAMVEDGGYGREVCIPIISKVLEACMDAMDKN